MNPDDFISKSGAERMARDNAWSALNMVMGYLSGKYESAYPLIDSIKSIRSHTGCGLKEAKDLIEALVKSAHSFEEKRQERVNQMFDIPGQEEKSEKSEVYVVCWVDDDDDSRDRWVSVHGLEEAKAHALKVAENQYHQAILITRLTHEVIRTPAIKEV